MRYFYSYSTIVKYLMFKMHGILDRIMILVIDLIYENGNLETAVDWLFICSLILVCLRRLFTVICLTGLFIVDGLTIFI